MTEEKPIPESELQDWLTEKAERGEFIDYIENVSDLRDTLWHRERGERANVQSSKDAAQRALSICRMLADAEPFTANMSIAPAGQKQMRPDLTLLADSGNYILVELKTKKHSERQGVQELLAYSAAMRLQHPHVNEFVYVLVARRWDELLRFSVLSLIIDGKYVLPLQCRRHGEKDFLFHIRTDLFDYDTSPFYLPTYALTPYTLAVSTTRGPRRANDRLTAYFEDVAQKAVDECQRVGQSGFALIWSNPMSRTDEILSLTLATVNQNWRHSEHTPGECRHLGFEEPTRLDKIFDRQAKAIRRETLKSVKDQGRRPDDLDKAWANERTLSLRSDSGLSGDLIEKYRNRDKEDEFRSKDGNHLSFDSESVQNLSVFLQYLYHNAILAYGRLIGFKAFGDLADYVWTGDAAGDVLYPKKLWSFFELMECFEWHKLKKLPVEPAETSPVPNSVEF
ncbi:hypothetical protein BCh11DRAFT_07508 [Burkholderia sp. Ch1-1]|nr:hypothetical protein BCh11DRAFT_07508 [Burkholderia sp. Ch1-1]